MSHICVDNGKRTRVRSSAPSSGNALILAFRLAHPSSTARRMLTFVMADLRSAESRGAHPQTAFRP